MEINNYSRKVAKDTVTLLRKTRLAAEVTNQEIADRLGVSRQSIGSKLHGADIRISELAEIAGYLGERPSEILRKAEQAADAERKTSQHKQNLAA